VPPLLGGERLGLTHAQRLGSIWPKRALRFFDYSHDYGYTPSMATVSKGVLKARMLEFFRRVEETGEELIVTDNNRPVLRVTPIRSRESTDELFADARGKVLYHEDVLTPTTEEWPES
jgi:prevent-host-death family protein